MRHTVVLLAAAAIVAGGAAIAIPVAAAATPNPARDVVIPSPGAVEQRYGIVRYDAGAHRWAVLNTPLFQSAGLTGVSCSGSTGKLTVGFAPLGTIGTFTVNEDESYAGRYDAGAAITSAALTITFRKPSTGAAVSCADSQLQIANSSLQVLVIGTATGPTGGPTSPTASPPTVSAPPPITPSAVTPPPDLPDPSDPADPTTPPIIIG
jgi:hypothetical protein